MENAQDQWVFLNWVVKQKFSYLLRHLPASASDQRLARMDHMLRGTFIRVIGQGIDDMSWELAKLPIQDDGFGMGDVSISGPAAFTANILETKEAVLQAIPSAKSYFALLDLYPVPFHNAQRAVASRPSPEVLIDFLYPYRQCIETICGISEDNRVQAVESIYAQSAGANGNPHKVQKVITDILTQSEPPTMPVSSAATGLRLVHGSIACPRTATP
mmetsp:Transcript_34070/g.63600  ORF Transcript_34070/g.63600 Transcript_34070/m.63600 type:complete len:216 (+) Transcript_34070:426-1073(+)